jgi:hypothetical protein
MAESRADRLEALAAELRAKRAATPRFPKDTFIGASERFSAALAECRWTCGAVWLEQAAKLARLHGRRSGG